MKKILVIVGILFLLLVIAGVVVAVYFDRIVKAGVESVAPGITQTTVTLAGVSLSPLSGAASLKGLVIGNPPGYTAPEAVRIGRAAVRLEPTSLLHDKVIIRSIELHEPEITFEGNPLGENNLQKILDNVKAKTAADAAGTNAATAKSAGKKLQVDDVVITGAKVNARVRMKLLGQEVNQDFPLTLPELRLSQLGQGPEGITSAELTGKLLDKVKEAALPEIEKLAGDFVKNKATDLLKKATGGSSDAVKKAADRLGDLLKKK